MPESSPVFQTWNPIVEPDPCLVIGEAEFERPVVNADALKGLRQLSHLHQQPDRRIWFCGSYASHGIPLLESAGQVSDVGCSIPWCSTSMDQYEGVVGHFRGRTPNDQLDWTKYVIPDSQNDVHGTC